MSTQLDLTQACLDLSNAALALFDIIDAKGVNAPLEDHGDMMKLMTVIDSSEKIRAYYYHRNIQRMLALGVSPETLLRMGKEDNG